MRQGPAKPAGKQLSEALPIISGPAADTAPGQGVSRPLSHRGAVVAGVSSGIYLTDTGWVEGHPADPALD